MSYIQIIHSEYDSIPFSQNSYISLAVPKVESIGSVLDNLI